MNYYIVVALITWVLSTAFIYAVFMRHDDVFDGELERWGFSLMFGGLAGAMWFMLPFIGMVWLIARWLARWLVSYLDRLKSRNDDSQPTSRPMVAEDVSNCTNCGSTFRECSDDSPRVCCSNCVHPLGSAPKSGPKRKGRDKT